MSIKKILISQTAPRVLTQYQAVSDKFGVEFSFNPFFRVEPLTSREFRAQHITLDMDTQEITLDGNVKGSVKDTKQIAETDGTNSEEKSENNQERKGN